jgi:hypothetical protein
MTARTTHIPTLLRQLQYQKLHVHSHEQLEDRYCITLHSGAVISIFNDGEIEVTPPRPNVCIGIVWSRLDEILPQHTRYLRPGLISARGSSSVSLERVERPTTTEFPLSVLFPRPCT